jgi:hypothetical protein
VRARPVDRSLRGDPVIEKDELEALGDQMASRKQRLVA